MEKFENLCARVLSAKADELRDHVFEQFNSAAVHCDSPIERVMLALLVSRLTCTEAQG